MAILATIETAQEGTLDLFQVVQAQTETMAGQEIDGPIAEQAMNKLENSQIVEKTLAIDKTSISMNLTIYKQRQPIVHTLAYTKAGNGSTFAFCGGEKESYPDEDYLNLFIRHLEKILTFPDVLSLLSISFNDTEGEVWNFMLYQRIRDCIRSVLLKVNNLSCTFGGQLLPIVIDTVNALSSDALNELNLNIRSTDVMNISRLIESPQWEKLEFVTIGGCTVSADVEDFLHLEKFAMAKENISKRELILLKEAILGARSKKEFVIKCNFFNEVTEEALHAIFGRIPASRTEGDNGEVTTRWEYPSHRQNFEVEYRQLVGRDAHAFQFTFKALLPSTN